MICGASDDSIVNVYVTSGQVKTPNLRNVL